MSTVEKHVNMLSHGNTSQSSLSLLCRSTAALPRLSKMLWLSKLSSFSPPNVLIEKGLVCFNASPEPAKRHCWGFEDLLIAGSHPAQTINEGKGEGGNES